ncbi:MAG: hypothetical protein K2G12_06650, partial [Prevotella sp.]|nr:hypothetical protein [Prevotella sp.]
VYKFFLSPKQNKMKVTVKAIMVLLGILLSNLPMFAQTKNPEHHACLTGNILNISEMKALRYNDFHGCGIRISTISLIAVIWKSAMKSALAHTISPFYPPTTVVRKNGICIATESC